MPTNVTFNGTVYPVPTQSDLRWAPSLTRYLVALGTYSLSPTGGTFTLTGNVDFGSTYGLLVKYITSKTATPATAGVFRLAKTDTIEWRDNAGTGENVLAIDSSNNLTYNSVIVPTGLATLADGKIWIGSAGNLPVAQTLTGDVTVDNTGLTAIGALKIVDAQVSNSAAIAYAKLNLSGSIVNTDIGSSASIAFSKLAALTADRVLLSDGSGVISASSVSNISLSYLDATSSIQTQLNGKEPTVTKGDLTELTSAILTIGSGTGAVIGAGTTITVQAATNSVPGYLTASDHTTFAAALPAASFTDAAVTGKLLTGYSSGAGTLATTNTILEGFNILNGNDGLRLLLTGGTLSGDLTLTNAKNIIFTEKSAGTDTISLRAPDSVTTTYALQLPPAVAGAGQYLYDAAGNGILSWNTPSGSGTVNSGAAGRLGLYASATTVISDTYVQNTKNITLDIATQASRSADLAITIPNPGDAVTTANVVLDKGNYTLSGTYTGPTFVTPALGAATATSLTFSPTTGGIIGTTTNDDAAAGKVGEYVEAVTSETNAGTTATWTDKTSISLTAGDWNITAVLSGELADGTTVCTVQQMGISTTSGNSTTGLVFGSNWIGLGLPTTYSPASPKGGSIANYRMSLSTTTTVYLKYYVTYSGGNFAAGARLSARRVR